MFEDGESSLDNSLRTCRTWRKPLPSTGEDDGRHTCCDAIDREENQTLLTTGLRLAYSPILPILRHRWSEERIRFKFYLRQKAKTWMVGVRSLRARHGNRRLG